MNTAPKLHETLQAAAKRLRLGVEGPRIADELDAIAAALAPPSGEGVDAFERAMKASWEMVVPTPAWAAGSFIAGQNSGMVDALKTVRENYESEIARQIITPPPASQEREGKFRKAWYAVCTALDEVSPGWLAVNADVTATDLACTAIRELASPPSSAAEESNNGEPAVPASTVRQQDDACQDASLEASPKRQVANPVLSTSVRGLTGHHDFPPVPPIRAAEQAKPDDEMNHPCLVTKEGAEACPWYKQYMNLKRWAEGVMNDGRLLPVAEQAQAGEVWRYIWNPMGMIARDRKQFAECDLTEYVTLADYNALLRRLAGGVMVDDAMVSAESFSRQTLYDQRDSVYKVAERAGPKLYVALKNLLEAVEERPDDMGIESITLADARAALVAALGAK